MKITTIYEKGIIEDYNAVEAEFMVDVILNTREHLHSSYVNVEITLESKLTRSCEDTIRARNAIIDGIVIVLSMLASIAYSSSVIRAVKLTKVHM